MPAISDQIAESFTRQLARGALNGVGPLDPARDVAERALAEHRDAEAAIDAIVGEHTRLAAANGFVTGLGGFIMLPVAVPANLMGFYTLAARMVAGIAHINGYDLDKPETRVAVLAALTGDDIGKLLAKAGMVLPAGGVTSAWLRRMAPSLSTMINKAIGLRLLVGTSGRLLTKLGRAIPLAGGLIGGTVDVALIRSIASHAREEFGRLPDQIEQVTVHANGSAPAQS